jgi:hypothetical protein
MWIHLPILESDCGHLAAYTRLNAQAWEAEIGVRFWTSSTWWEGWWWGICKLNSTKLWQNWRLTSSLALYYWHLALRCDHVLSFIGNTLEISVETNAVPEPSWAPPLLLHIFSILIVHWVSAPVLFFLSASTAATYIFTTLTCTTTILSLEPCALDAEFSISPRVAAFHTEI